jgi:Raf kinase inhibitor-like YbhB/YbcL family protein
MAILGKLLRNRRAGETHLAWNQPSLAGPETLRLAALGFSDGEAMPVEHAGRRVGGKDLSPALAWGELPSDTAQVLLLVEDVDAPTSKPFVHCVAVISPALAGDGLPAGALSEREPGAGVTLLRGQMGTGYRGPAPIKGHGPHRYVFEVFALGAKLPDAVEGAPLARLSPRLVPTVVGSGSVLARGRLTGTYERS